jgi:predicted CXXCH cytochrome family protein
MHPPIPGQSVSCRLLLLLQALFLLVLVAGPAGAQIRETKHNLTISGTGVNTFSGTEEVCVFCHTPQGLDVSATVPLWNRLMPSPASYQTYDTLGTALVGKVAPVGSVSLACLSCHDGTSAMSAVVNVPAPSGTLTWESGTWSGANQSGGKLRAGLITNIGTDLRNDHPIGVQYGRGIFAAIPAHAAAGTNDFVRPQSAVINETRVWWIDTEMAPNGSRQKTDVILYTRSTAEGYAGQGEEEPFVECASCHDPHSGQPLFLRQSNAGSALCLACHIR